MRKLFLLNQPLEKPEAAYLTLLTILQTDVPQLNHLNIQTMLTIRTASLTLSAAELTLWSHQDILDTHQHGLQVERIL